MADEAGLLNVSRAVARLTTATLLTVCTHTHRSRDITNPRNLAMSKCRLCSKKVTNTLYDRLDPNCRSAHFDRLKVQQMITTVLLALVSA